MRLLAQDRQRFRKLFPMANRFLEAAELREAFYSLCTTQELDEREKKLLKQYKDLPEMNVGWFMKIIQKDASAEARMILIDEVN